MRNTIIEVVESHINGLGKGNFSQASLAPDVTYQSPISPKKVGQEAIDFLLSPKPLIKGVEIKSHLVEGDTWATVFDLNTVHGVVHVFDRFRVENGLLNSINP